MEKFEAALAGGLIVVGDQFPFVKPLLLRIATSLRERPGVKSMKINPPSASFLAVQDALQRVYKTSSNRDRRTIAFVMAILTKACGDASVTTIADNLHVVAAVAALLAAVTDHLKVRVDAEKAGLFSGLLFVRPVFPPGESQERTGERATRETIQGHPWPRASLWSPHAYAPR